MLNVVFPALCESRSPAFYLAAEEYLARNSGEDFFMLWRVGPSVIFGRNQDMEAEVNLPFCRREGIGVFRRKSGGGCVYADKGNLMISSGHRGTTSPFFSAVSFRLWPSFSGVAAMTPGLQGGTIYWSRAGKSREVHSTAPATGISCMRPCFAIPISGLWSGPLPLLRKNSGRKE